MIVVHIREVFCWSFPAVLRKTMALKLKNPDLGVLESKWNGQVTPVAPFTNMV